MIAQTILPSLNYHDWESIGVNTDYVWIAGGTRRQSESDALDVQNRSVS